MKLVEIKRNISLAKLNFLLGVLGLMARCFHRIYMGAVSIYAIYAPPPKMVFQPTKGSGCLTGLTLSHPSAICMLVRQNINLQIFWGQRLKFQEWENLAGQSWEPYIPSKLPLSFIIRSSDHSIRWWSSYCHMIIVYCHMMITVSSCVEKLKSKWF